MKKLLTTTITCLLIFLALATHAQSSNLSIQGVLRTAEGDAVENGEYALTFRLYVEANTGNSIWDETIEAVNVKGGIYSVILGSGNTPLDAKFDQTYFLGVSVEGGIEMRPRARLTSSPYALSLIGDDNIFPNSGNVGVGSATPQSKLTVGNEAGTLGFDVEDDITNNATITTRADGIAFSTEGTDNAYYFAGEVTEVMRIKKDGKVGIGTADPQNHLHVVGDDKQVKIEGTDNAKLVFSKAGTTADIGFDTANGNNLIVSNPNNNVVLNAPNGSAQIVGNDIMLDPTDAVQINKTGEALKLIGMDSTSIGFYSQGTDGAVKASFGFNDSDHPDDFSIVTTGGDLRLNTTDGRVLVNKQLEVAIENESFDFYVGYHRWVDNNGIYAGDPWTSKAGIVSHKTIVAPVFRTFSDQRIKKDFKLSDAQRDLSTLMQIEVTDYRHKDVANHGFDFRKGLVAQQVKSIFPEAVYQSKGYIPNIYDYTSKVEKTGGTLIITMETAHGLAKGDMVKIFAGNAQENILVEQVNDDYSFTIKPREVNIKKGAFIYGKEVNDFHSVDYDRVFTLAVSATQELARKVENLEKEKMLLQSKINKTDDILKVLNDKVEALEETFNMTGQN